MHVDHTGMTGIWRARADYRRGLSIPTQKNDLPLKNLSRVMLTFATTHSYPTWKLHSSTCGDELGSPLWYNKRNLFPVRWGWQHPEINTSSNATKILLVWDGCICAFMCVYQTDVQINLCNLFSWIKNKTKTQSKGGIIVLYSRKSRETGIYI